MTVNLTVPVQQQPVAADDGRMTLPWYRYFHNLQSASSGLVSIPSGTVLGNSSGVTGAPSPITIGTGLSLSNGVLSSVAVFTGTTDNVPEGSLNLYFTNTRARDAVGGILKNGSLVTLTYKEDTSITADVNLARLWMFQ